MTFNIIIAVFTALSWMKFGSCTIQRDRTVFTKLELLEVEINAMKRSIQRNEANRKTDLQILRHDINIKLESIAAKVLSEIIDDKAKAGEIRGVVDGSVNALLQQQQLQIQQLKCFASSVRTCQPLSIPKKADDSSRKLHKRFRVINQKLKKYEKLMKEIQSELNLGGELQSNTKKKKGKIIKKPSKKNPVACTHLPVPNYSFETQTVWEDFLGGWISDSSQAQDGGRSAKITDGGAVHEFNFSNPVRRMTLSGYSKNVNGPSTIPSTTDYSLYCDLTKASGGNIWGLHTPFSPGNSNWHKVTLTIDVPESDAFVLARCHVLYRNAGSGEAFFDNITAFLPSDDLTDPSQCS